MTVRGNRIVPVILSGGSGSRLWPLSRDENPKQFLPLLGKGSLFEYTIRRVADPVRFAPPVVVANNDHRFLVAERLRGLTSTPPTIILEPCGRDTAPAAVAGALLALREDAHALILLMPSDHVIADEAAFRTAVDQGQAAAAAGQFVLFGIPPTYPATGYGYIDKGAALGFAPSVHAVDRFVEKPDLITAERYVSKGYLWNSGMFLLPAQGLIEACARHAPAVLGAVRAALDAARSDMDFLRLDPEAFGASPSISLDYAVMEKTDRAAVVPAAMGWADLGSWSSLKEISTQDVAGNAAVGPVVLEDVSNSYLRSNGPLIAALGVEDLVIVATEDAVLVAHASRDQDVKALVARIAAEGHATIHDATVHRPWGSYRSVHSGDRFQVKRITVKPGARLSLQSHKHRAEHWVVVNGTALVTRDGEAFELAENQSTFLPQGCIHRLANPGTEPLNLIEVQSGSYLGEDDIERFDDDYARA
jgi:mannose-1-phosphate guanylyltransferase/mannose-1-phosphate guanylyltransferase/mannose-6-phosphate isomerase